MHHARPVLLDLFVCVDVSHLLVTVVVRPAASLNSVLEQLHCVPCVLQGRFVWRAVKALMVTENVPKAVFRLLAAESIRLAVHVRPEPTTLTALPSHLTHVFLVLKDHIVLKVVRKTLAMENAQREAFLLQAAVKRKRANRVHLGTTVYLGAPRLREVVLAVLDHFHVLEKVSTAAVHNALQIITRILRGHQVALLVILKMAGTLIQILQGVKSGPSTRAMKPARSVPLH